MKKAFHILALLLMATAIKAQQPKLMLPIGHTSTVFSTAFSPDGKYIVTSSFDGTAKVWDAISGMLVLDLKGHKGSVFSAGFSPDGKYIVTASGTLWRSASGDNTAKVWNAENGELVADLKGHTNTVFSAAFSADGKFIVTSSRDSTAKIWNTVTGKLLADLRGLTNEVYFATFSPDGKYIITTSPENTAKLWNANSGRLVANLKGHTGEVYIASFSPDGKYIVTASRDSTGKVWNSTTGQWILDLKGHTGAVFKASFSPDGKNIVTASGDSTAKVWNTATGRLVADLKGHKSGVSNAIFSPNGKYIATASYDGIAKVWNSNSGILIADLVGYKSLNAVLSVSFSPDGKYLVTSYADGSVKVWDAVRGSLVSDLRRHTNFVVGASFSPDGKYMVNGSPDGTAKVWNTLSGQLVATLKGHTSVVTCATFSSDGKYIATASWDSTAKVWNTLNGQLIADLKGHLNFVSGVSFSADAKYIVTASRDSTARVWNMLNGQLITTLKGHTDEVYPATFSPDGKYIITASPDNTAKLWNSMSGQLLADLKGHTDVVNSASFSPNGKYILTASADSTAKVWNVFNGKIMADLKGHKGEVTFASFSPDEKYIATASFDSTVKIWNAMSGQLMADLRGYTNKTTYVVFSPEGKYLVTKSGTKTAKVWDAVNWKLIKNIEANDGYFDGIDFINNHIANANNSVVSIYDLNTGEKLYTFIAVDSGDYLVVDKDNHYDGTPAARKLLYFTCGKEIIELDQVKDQLWVPNLAERIIKGDSINAKSLDELNICGLTPEVEDSSFKADEFYFKILPRRGGLGETALYLNGIEVKRYKRTELKNSGGTYQLIIKKAALKDLFVAGKENRLTVKAFILDNTISSRGLIISEDKSNDKATAPNLFAVMVGVSDYKGDELDLKYPGKDATDISAVVSNAAKNLLNTDGAEHVFMYNLTTDKDHYQLPEKKSIKKVLDEIGIKATANDILLIFFAGHGVMRGTEDNKKFYFLTADASLNSSFGAVADVGISTSELTEWIKPANIKAQKRIMIFDACNSGQAIKDFVKLGNKDQGYVAARGNEKGQEIKAIEKLNNQSGLFILSASASNRAAYEMGRYSQGLLTYSLLKAIKQQPDILNEGKYLDVSKWFNAARESVSELSKETGSRQDPQIVSNTNFNIGVVDEKVMAKIVLQNEKPLFAACNFQNADENNPVDNLGLNKLIDQQLNSISSRGTDAPIVYAGTTSSAEAYTLSGRYNITGNTITIKVFIIQNKEVKQKIDLTGTKEKLDEFASLISTQAAEWASKNK